MPAAVSPATAAGPEHWPDGRNPGPCGVRRRGQRNEDEGAHGAIATGAASARLRSDPGATGTGRERTAPGPARTPSNLRPSGRCPLSPPRLRSDSAHRAPVHASRRSIASAAVSASSTRRPGRASRSAPGASSLGAASRPPTGRACTGCRHGGPATRQTQHTPAPQDGRPLASCARPVMTARCAGTGSGSCSGRAGRGGRGWLDR